MEAEKQNGPVIGEYKGKPVITLNPESRFPFTFGMSKAKLIVKHYDAIVRFIDQYDTSSTTS